MPNGADFGGPGQREKIIRGERTDPRAILGQAAALAVCGSFVVLLVLVGVMVYQGGSLYYAARYLRDTWRWWSLTALVPWAIAALCASVALFVEIFDPNWPNPRKATGSTRPLFPLSREREQPRRTIKIGLDDLLASLEAEDDSE